jgi:hypothetical protein
MSGATWTDLRGGPRVGDLVADPVYPIELESDVVLRDGSTVRIRPARPGDRDRLEDYFIAMSPETRKLRFWAQSVDIRGAAAAALDQDYVHHLTLLAFSGGDEGKVVGGAQYVVIDEHRAEVSFSDADKLQGRGLGSLLLAEDYPSAPWVRIPHTPLLAVPRALGGFKGKGPLAGPFPH